MEPKEKFFYKYGSYETCYELDYFLNQSIEDETTFEIIGAQIVYGSGEYYCSYYGEGGLVSEGNCGNNCKAYTPRNGKSGRCKHSNNCYSPNGNAYTIKNGRHFSV